MLSNPALKLVIGVAIGGAVYYTIRKKSVKQVTLSKPPPNQQNLAPNQPLQKPVKPPILKQNKLLPPTAFIRSHNIRHPIREFHF